MTYNVISTLSLPHFDARIQNNFSGRTTDCFLREEFRALNEEFLSRLKWYSLPKAIHVALFPGI